MDISRPGEVENLREMLMNHIGRNQGRHHEFPDIQPVHIAVLKLTPADAISQVEQGFDVNALDRQGRTPLLLAAEEGKPEMVEALVKRCGADVTIADRRMQTPLHHLPMAETTRILLEAGAAAGAKDCNGNTPLHNAEDAESVRMLVTAGADVNARNSKGFSPLHEAARGDLPDVVEALIESGAEIEMKNHAGETPLMLAVRYSKVDAVDVLCNAGADINTEAHVPIETFRGLGLLYEAVVMKNERKEIGETLDVLFKHGLDPRGQDKDGDTPSDIIRGMGLTGIADRIDAKCHELDAKDHAAAMMERARTKGMQGSRGREMSL
jgi:ankyrin repeat protein